MNFEKFFNVLKDFKDNYEDKKYLLFTLHSTYGCSFQFLKDDKLNFEEKIFLLLLQTVFSLNNDCTSISRYIEYDFLRYKTLLRTNAFTKNTAAEFNSSEYEQILSNDISRVMIEKKHNHFPNNIFLFFNKAVLDKPILLNAGNIMKDILESSKDQYGINFFKGLDVNLKYININNRMVKLFEDKALIDTSHRNYEENKKQLKSLPNIFDIINFSKDLMAFEVAYDSIKEYRNDVEGYENNVVDSYPVKSDLVDKEVYQTIIGENCGCYINFSYLFKLNYLSRLSVNDPEKLSELISKHCNSYETVFKFLKKRKELGIRNIKRKLSEYEKGILERFKITEKRFLDYLKINGIVTTAYPISMNISDFTKIFLTKVSDSCRLLKRLFTGFDKEDLPKLLSDMKPIHLGHFRYYKMQIHQLIEIAKEKKLEKIFDKKLVSLVSQARNLKVVNSAINTNFLPFDTVQNKDNFLLQNTRYFDNFFNFDGKISFFYYSIKRNLQKLVPYLNKQDGINPDIYKLFPTYTKYNKKFFSSKYPDIFGRDIGEFQNTLDFRSQFVKDKLIKLIQGWVSIELPDTIANLIYQMAWGDDENSFIRETFDFKKTKHCLCGELVLFQIVNTVFHNALVDVLSMNQTEDNSVKFAVVKGIKEDLTFKQSCSKDIFLNNSTNENNLTTERFLKRLNFVNPDVENSLNELEPEFKNNEELLNNLSKKISSLQKELIESKRCGLAKNLIKSNELLENFVDKLNQTPSLNESIKEILNSLIEAITINYILSIVHGFLAVITIIFGVIFGVIFLKKKLYLFTKS